MTSFSERDGDLLFTCFFFFYWCTFEPMACHSALTMLAVKVFLLSHFSVPSLSVVFSSQQYPSLCFFLLWELDQIFLWWSYSPRSTEFFLLRLSRPLVRCPPLPPGPWWCSTGAGSVLFPVSIPDHLLGFLSNSPVQPPFLPFILSSLPPCYNFLPVRCLFAFPSPPLRGPTRTRTSGLGLVSIVLDLRTWCFRWSHAFSPPVLGAFSFSQFLSVFSIFFSFFKRLCTPAYRMTWDLYVLHCPYRGVSGTAPCFCSPFYSVFLYAHNIPWVKLIADSLSPLRHPSQRFFFSYFWPPWGDIPAPEVPLPSFHINPPPWPSSHPLRLLMFGFLNPLVFTALSTSLDVKFFLSKRRKRLHFFFPLFDPPTFFGRFSSPPPSLGMISSIRFFHDLYITGNFTKYSSRVSPLPPLLSITTPHSFLAWLFVFLPSNYIWELAGIEFALENTQKGLF